jgi:hypothetical protein
VENEDLARARASPRKMEVAKEIKIEKEVSKLF